MTGQLEPCKASTAWGVRSEDYLHISALVVVDAHALMSSAPGQLLHEAGLASGCGALHQWQA